MNSKDSWLRYWHVSTLFTFCLDIRTIEMVTCVAIEIWKAHLGCQHVDTVWTFQIKLLMATWYATDPEAERITGLYNAYSVQATTVLRVSDHSKPVKSEFEPANSVNVNGAAVLETKLEPNFTGT